VWYSRSMARKRHILAELAAMRREDVEAELEQVRQEKAGLDMEEALLGQVLRIHQFANTGVPGSKDVLDGLAASAPEQLERNLSANVLTIVRQAGGHELSPADVQELLADRGVHADLSAIRVALRRWAERNKIIKNGHVYQALAGDVVSGRYGRTSTS
jgi:hypothetical protein